MTKHKYLGAAAILLLIVLLAANAFASLRDDLRDRNFNLYSAPFPAGNMILQDLKGRSINLASLRGKVVILNFWKIDCAPCSAEKPILERIYRKFAPRGLEVIAVNLFDSPEKLRSFLQNSGLTFTIAFDSTNQLSLKQHKLGAGLPTTFVVNANSEAIYEIPGVPTTYVLNQKGEIIGSSVGLVNWEEEPIVTLLEMLLGPQTSTVANSALHLDDPVLHSSKPILASMAQVDSNSQTRAVDQKGFTKSSPQLPFQTVQSGSKSNNPEVLPSTVNRRRDQPRTQTQPMTPSQVKSSPDKKVERTELKKPKPFVPVRSSPPASQPVQPVAGAQIQTPSSQTEPAQVPSPAAGKSQPLPPLPPALPYSPSNPQPPPANIVPDENGTVMARVPESFGGTGGVLQVPGGSSSPLPPAQPFQRANPIGGFILDSFGQSARTQRPIPIQPPGAAEAPASSFYEQLSRDVMQLGSGIKDTFSRILPSR